MAANVVTNEMRIQFAKVLAPAQPKPATVAFSDTEPDEPVVQEVSRG